MADIYLCGHGEWKTSGMPTGFASVPAGTTVSLYTPVGRFLGIGQAMKILAKAPDALKPDEVVQPYRTVTDLLLHPAPEMRVRFMTAALSSGANAVMVDKESLLSELMAEYAGNDLHWLACRVRFSGLDTTEGGFNDDYML